MQNLELIEEMLKKFPRTTVKVRNYIISYDRGFEMFFLDRKKNRKEEALTASPSFSVVFTTMNAYINEDLRHDPKKR